MNSEKSLRRFTWLFVVIAAVISYVAQLNFDTWKRYGDPKINVPLNVFIEPQPLTGEAAKIASFGAREFLADIYWLQLIQYYGGGDPFGGYRKLPELFNTIVTLSPKNLIVYQTGLLILPGEGAVDEAIKLGEKGKRNLPDSWEIPYYLGLVYHIHKDDYAKAAELFLLATTKPGVPENAKYFAAIYYNRAEQRIVAYHMFKTIYDTTSDEHIKERTAKYLVHLEGIFLLEEGVKVFNERFGRRPQDLNELVTRRVIESLPVSPLNLTFTYNPETGAIGEDRL